MKKLILLILMPFIPALAQNPSYKRQIIYKQESATVITNPNPRQAIIYTSYLDGFGKPVQEIAHKQSSTNKDLITHIEYDAVGYKTKEHLIYTDDNSSLDYRQNAKDETFEFYSMPSQANNEATSYPYSEKLIDPLGRILQQSAPGDAWYLGSGHEVKINYLTNTANEVKIYTANAIWDPVLKLYKNSLINNGYYITENLYKTVEKDENWVSGKGHTIEIFKNKEGQIILKRIYNMVPSRGGPIARAHDTYYIYDQYGNLSIVLPPLSDGSGSEADLNGVCYQYRYDRRNRLVEKKLPGKDWEFIVYDKLDRVIASGPAYSPFGDEVRGWLVTKYDVFGRAVYKAWYNGQPATLAGRNTMQQQADGSSQFSESRTSSGSVNGIAVSYTNNVFPTSNLQLLSASYYDSYGFPNASATPSTVFGENILAQPKGLPTGSWARVLTGQNESLGETVTLFYDKKGRLVHSYLKNYLGGLTQVDTQIDFTGKTLQTLTEHKKSTSDNLVKVKEVFAYTDQDRLLTRTHQIDEGEIELISKYEYDELGKLKRKSVGGTDISGQTAHQQVDYGYNIRGWLTGINPSLSERQGDPEDLFNFAITYNNPERAEPLYNGNISETYWRTASDRTYRKYEYTYDTTNRLVDAIYAKPYDNYSQTSAYTEMIRYDMNGNITQLSRNGNNDGPYGMEIDRLKYSYDPENPNRLMKVTDESLDPVGFRDGTNTGDDYSYDDYGNMTSDANKGITKITYNHLNLPVSINFGTGPDKIEYLYNANGKKLRKTVRKSNINTQPGYIQASMDYLDGFHYDKGILKFFPTAEGYVSHVSGQFNYVYNYTDHLGNIRLSYGRDRQTNALKIIEENHYYPFGMKHTNYNVDRLSFQEKDSNIVLKAIPTGTNILFNYDYKYNGKEFQDELGLNLYDYGARNYDPAIGRWMNIDPLAEMSRRFSPYAYANNNPVYFIDPDGMMAEEFDDPTDPPKYGEGTTTGTMETLVNGMPSGISIDPVQLNEVLITNEQGVGDYEVADNEDSNDIDTDNEQHESLSSSDVRKSVVEPTFFKLLEVEANALTVAGFVRESRVAGIIRNGRAPVSGITNGLKTTGNVLGGIGIGVTGYQYFSGQISGKEASVDAFMGAVGFFGPWGAAISLTYFAGKAIYEYSSGETLFDKPTQ